MGVLEDVRDALEHIAEDTAGITYEEFAGDRRTRQLVAHNLGKIGEAMHRLRRDDQATFKRLSNSNQYVTLRNIRVDGHDATDLSTVWETVRNQLPALGRDIDALLLQGSMAKEEGRIGADEMSRVITDHLEAIQALCREYGISKLEVFGSAVTDRFDPSRSDVDFIVEFPPGYELGPWHDRYFELKERLSAVLGRSVDLVMAESMRKPRFIESANQTRRVLYAA